MKKFTFLFTLFSAILLMNSQVFAQNTYYEFGSLNYSSTDVGSDWTELGTGGPFEFTKSQDDSQVEVIVNTRYSIGTLNANGVEFSVIVDGSINADYGNLMVVSETNVETFGSIFAVFENLSAGTHTVDIWAKAPNGDASGVGVDPGGWGGKIILKVLGETTVSVPEPPTAPEDQIMQQNHPNPFYPETTIEYMVQQPSQVVLNVYDNAGRLVKTLVDEYKTSGEYSVKWNSKDESGKTVSSGSYYYQIRVGDFVSSKKMIVLK